MCGHSRSLQLSHTAGNVVATVSLAGLCGYICVRCPLHSFLSGQVIFSFSGACPRSGLRVVNDPLLMMSFIVCVLGVCSGSCRRCCCCGSSCRCPSILLFVGKGD